jgi:hypothetical protein
MLLANGNGIMWNGTGFGVYADMLHTEGKTNYMRGREVAKLM